MKILVKICGIKTKSAALASAKYGADFLGFNFVPSSKRKVTPEIASQIIKAITRAVSSRPSASASEGEYVLGEALSEAEGDPLRQFKGIPRLGLKSSLGMTPLFVGVFMNQPSDDIRKILSKVKLNMLQFHGNESPNFCQNFGLPYIKAFGVGLKTSVAVLGRQMSKYKAKYFLLDRPTQGKGQAINLKKVKRLASKFPVMLAGGLTAKNVCGMIAKAGKIKAVDVAGGVETKGVKDINKIKHFITVSKFA